MPDLDSEVLTAIRRLTTGIGGVLRSKTLMTVSGKREYGIAESATIGVGFPEDFISSVRMIDANGNRIDPILMGDRLESATSGGTPSGYYIWQRGRRIGFDVIPSAALDLTWEYFGKGDDVTEDADEVLAEISAMDDDPFWDGITFSFAERYFQRLYVKSSDADGRPRFYENMKLFEHKGAQARLAAAGILNSFNADRMAQIDSPDLLKRMISDDDVFGSFVDRASEEGDVTREW